MSIATTDTFLLDHFQLVTGKLGFVHAEGFRLLVQPAHLGMRKLMRCCMHFERGDCTAKPGCEGFGIQALLDQLRDFQPSGLR